MELNTTKIHIDLVSVPIIKTNLDKLIFGLFKYASEKGFNPPFIFTANTHIQDIGYLGVLKNNNVRLLDAPPKEDAVDILVSGEWNKSVHKLMSIPNMPIFTKNTDSRACVYIDWDNIQVSVNNIPSFISGICTFIDKIKVHTTYKIYSFLHNKVLSVVKDTLKKLNNVYVITIIKDKRKNNDEDMIKFIKYNTLPGDSICVASGDRDFSSMMVEYVRNSYNVFLIYNKQSIYTFKHNVHWLGSINVQNLKVNSINLTQKTQKIPYKTKPCKFYNLSVCNTIDCSFLHMCGICGRSHKSKDFHPSNTNMKNIICKKYNEGVCNYSNISCNYLHICIKCKKNHTYNKCIMLYCPLCKINMESTVDYIVHQFKQSHLNLLYLAKKILNNKPKHILITDE